MKLTESYLRNIIKQELRNTLSSAGLHEAFASGMGELYKDFVEGGFPATPEAIEASLQDESGIYEVTAVLEQLATMKQDYGKVHNKLIPLVAYIVSNADKIKQAISTLKDPFDTKTKSEAMKHLEILAKSKARLNEEVDRRVADCIEFALKFYPTLMSQVDMSTFEEKLNFLSARHGRLPRTWAILFAIELALNPSNTGDGRSGQIPFTDY